MATHSSILAWRIPWTEEPGGLQSMGSQRVRQDWVTNTHTHTRTHTISFADNSKRLVCLYRTGLLVQILFPWIQWHHTSFVSLLPFLPALLHLLRRSLLFLAIQKLSSRLRPRLSPLFNSLLRSHHLQPWFYMGYIYADDSDFYIQPRFLFEFQTCIFNCLLSPFSLIPPHTIPKLYYTFKHLSLFS